MGFPQAESCTLPYRECSRGPRHKKLAVNVAFGSKTDLAIMNRDFRDTLESRHFSALSPPQAMRQALWALSL
jgi:hypothetical protein